MDANVLLALLVGLPLMLAAAGLLLNAYLVVRRPTVDPADLAVEALATESMDELLIELQRSVEQIQGQLAGQRTTLAGLMNDPGPSISNAPAPPLDRAPAALSTPTIDARAAPLVGADLLDLPVAVQRLVSEGLSDRAIARRMRIGLEEVRLARARAGRAS